MKPAYPGQHTSPNRFNTGARSQVKLRDLLYAGTFAWASLHFVLDVVATERERERERDRSHVGRVSACMHIAMLVLASGRVHTWQLLSRAGCTGSQVTRGGSLAHLCCCSN